MNTTLKTLVCAAALTAFAGAPFAVAQQQKNDQRQPQRQQTQDRTQDRNPDTVVRTATFELMLNRSSELMGMDIYDSRGEKVGAVADFVISRRSGQIDSVLVNTGAILGVGGKEVRVPYGTLNWNPVDERLVTTMNKTAIDAIPDFDRRKAGDLPLDNIHGYDRMDPNDRRNPDNARNPNDARDPNNATYGGPYGADRGILLSTVVGQDLNCLAQACGEVEDTIIEVNTGRVVYLVIDPDENFLGIADTLRIAPFSIARWNMDASEMQIDATKEQVLAAPEFDGDLLPFTSRTRITEIYRGYGTDAPALDRRASDSMRDANNTDRNNNADRNNPNRNNNTNQNDAMKDKKPSGNRPY